MTNQWRPWVRTETEGNGIRRRFCWSGLLLLFLTSLGVLPYATGRAAPRQDAPPPNLVRPPEEEVKPLPLPEGAPQEIRELVDQLATEGVTVDFEHRVVEVKGAILLNHMLPSYPIEYLIVNESGYTHEALGIVAVTPSKLNAAFLALGLTPGRTVEFVKKDPPPPVEDLIAGKAKEFDAIPPRGQVVDVAVRWTDEDGSTELRPIEDLIRYVTNGKSLPRRGFVYVGSRFHRVLIGVERQERFMADVQGNLVSLYLTGFGNCLFDMNSTEGVEAYLYDVNPETCPPQGTKVTFVFALR